MNEYIGGYNLTAEEFVAIMTLSGKTSVLGFQFQQISKEKLMDALCRLMEDKAMTQINGKFRLHKDLFSLIVPVVNAKRVIMLIPGHPEHTQVIYYMEKQTTMLQPTSYGRLSLRLIEKEQLAQSILDHMDFVFEQDIPEEHWDEPPAPAGVLQTEMETLAKGSEFVLEWMDVESKKRTGWMRVSEKGITKWVEWSAEGTYQCEVLMEPLLQELVKGEWQ